MDLKKEDCFRYFIMGFILWLFLKEVCGIDTFMIDEYASEPGVNNNSMYLPVENIQTSQGCPKTTLAPGELLPNGMSEQAAAFEKAHPNGEGVHKGTQYIDAGWQIGVNTLANQSLENANLQLRADPPIAKVEVGPFNNSTIAPHLDRKPLDDVGCQLNSSLPNTAVQHPNNNML